MADDVADDGGRRRGYFSAEEVGKVLRIGPRRVQQLAKEGVIPKASHGQYHLIEAVGGYVDYLHERLDRGSKKLDEDARLRAAQADLREIELARARGEVTKVEDEAYVVEGVLGVLLEAVAALPARMAVDCTGRTAKEVKELFEHECARIREDIYAGLKKLATRARQILGTREAATKKKSRRVGRRKSSIAQG